MAGDQSHVNRHILAGFHLHWQCTAALQFVKWQHEAGRADTVITRKSRYNVEKIGDIIRSAYRQYVSMLATIVVHVEFIRFVNTFRLATMIRNTLCRRKTNV